MKKVYLSILVAVFFTLSLTAMPGGNGNGGGNGNCNGPNPPPGCPVIPIDNHLIWLFGIGLAFTGYKVYKITKSKSIV